MSVKASARLKAISLYTGVGGLDFGFEAAGFQTVVALDVDPTACRALQQVRKWRVIEADVASITSKEILESAGLRRKEADVLIGGPPCQPFSKSGYWAMGDARRLDDPRSGTLGQFLRVLRDTLPKAFLLENVLGFAYSGKREGLELIERGIAAINAKTGVRYSIVVKAINAADFGVPQSRERFFVVGARDGQPFIFPKPTHRPEDQIDGQNGMTPYLTAWDAIGDLSPNSNDPSLVVTGKWADLLPSVPEGQNYLWHTARGGGMPLFGWRTRYWNFLLKLAKNKPAWTIQAQPGPATGPFHWKNRKLSAKELSRLQTFPEQLTFDGRWSEIQRLIGNAVPSALAEMLAREMRTQFFGFKQTRADLTLLPNRLSDTPAPERLLPVPQKYRSLMGDHSEHPGTGKGAGAMRRLQRVA